MTGADKIETSLLHLTNLSYLGSVEGHRPQYAVVVVYAGTIDKQRLAVEHKTLLGIV